MPGIMGMLMSMPFIPRPLHVHAGHGVGGDGKAAVGEPLLHPAHLVGLRDVNLFAELHDRGVLGASLEELSHLDRLVVVHDHSLHEVDVGFGRRLGHFTGSCGIPGKGLVAVSGSTGLDDRRCRCRCGLLRQGSRGTKDNDGGDRPKCGENQVRHVPPTMMQRVYCSDTGNRSHSNFLPATFDDLPAFNLSAILSATTERASKASLFPRQSNCLNINTSVIAVQSAFIRWR